MTNVINIPKLESRHKALSKLTGEPSVSDVDIAQAFLEDVVSATHPLVGGTFVSQETVLQIENAVREVYNEYICTFNEPLPIAIGETKLESFADLMFIPNRNSIDMVHCDEYIIISEWSLGEKENDEWKRGPHPKGEMDLGYYRRVYPDYYTKLRNLEVGEIIRLGTSRFQRRH